jgi:hypothetical protein
METSRPSQKQATTRFFGAVAHSHKRASALQYRERYDRWISRTASHFFDKSQRATPTWQMPLSQLAIACQQKS